MFYFHVPHRHTRKRPFPDHLSARVLFGSINRHPFDQYQDKEVFMYEKENAFNCFCLQWNSGDELEQSNKALWNFLVNLKVEEWYCSFPLVKALSVKSVRSVKILCSSFFCQHQRKTVLLYFSYLFLSKSQKSRNAAAKNIHRVSLSKFILGNGPWGICILIDI